jgi:N-acetylglucosamine-6-phosphate deacetylase
MFYIHHATILTPDERIDDGAVLIDRDRVMAVGATPQVTRPPQAQSIDASGLTLTPGFIDLQVNGGFGLDFTATPSTIWQVAARLPRYGVTTFLPTIISSPAETVAAAQAIFREGAPKDFIGATPLGLHLEGPFLNKAKRGAHNPAYLRPLSVDAIADWSLERCVRLATIAPELPGALDVIRTLRARGVVVSAGHSMASYDEARKGFDAGIRYGTHLFNAMPPLEHRAPGLPGALLTDSRATVGIIADGVHLHQAIVSLVWQSKGSSRLILVTDAMAALGMPPGRYQLGDFAVTVDDTSARLEGGTLAGSILSLDQAIRNLIDFAGCSLTDALPTVTTVPAKLLGLTDRGKCSPGGIADLTLLSPDRQVMATIVRGQIAWKSEEMKWD